MALIDADPQQKPQFYKPTYELDQEDLSRLSDELLTSLPLEQLPEGSRFACTEISADSKFANLGRYVEEEVFVKEFGNTPEEMVEQYGPYEAASRFWVVFDLNSRLPVGALRAIENSPAGLKTLNDIEEDYLRIPTKEISDRYQLDLDKTWDVGTVAVLREYRGRKHDFLPSLTLYRALYRGAVNEDIKDFVAIIDKDAKFGLDLMGVPFKPIMDSESFSYLGSKVSWALHSRVEDLVPGVETVYEATKDHTDDINQLINRNADRLAYGTTVDKLVI